AVPRPDDARGAADQERLYRGLQPEHGDPVDRRRTWLHRRGHPAARDQAATAEVVEPLARQADQLAYEPQARPDADLDRYGEVRRVELGRALRPRARLMDEHPDAGRAGAKAV